MKKGWFSAGPGARTVCPHVPWGVGFPCGVTGMGRGGKPRALGGRVEVAAR